MGSTYLSLTDDQLLQKIKQAGGEVMIGTWENPRTRRFEAGLRNPVRGMVMALSEHDDRAAAINAATELELRLDRLASEECGLRMRNLMDEADDGGDETGH